MDVLSGVSRWPGASDKFFLSDSHMVVAVDISHYHPEESGGYSGLYKFMKEAVEAGLFFMAHEDRFPKNPEHLGYRLALVPHKTFSVRGKTSEAGELLKWLDSLYEDKLLLRRHYCDDEEGNVSALLSRYGVIHKFVDHEEEWNGDLLVSRFLKLEILGNSMEDPMED